MKYAVYLFCACAGAAWAQASPGAGSDLRQVLQQPHAPGAPQPRTLSPSEREQLRQQLSDAARPRGTKK